MRLTHKSDKVEIEVDGEDVKTAFAQMAEAQEVFLNTHCGACDSSDVRLVVRENKGFVYHEVKCMECGSALAFGQKREGGTLFPKRKTKEGDWLPNNGWVKWQGNDDNQPF